MYVLDVDSAMKEIKTQFTNVTEPWNDSYLYPESGKWFWYDSWHFMTEVHEYIAKEAYQVLSKHQ